MQRKITLELNKHFYFFKREFEIEESQIFPLAEKLRKEHIHFKLTMGSHDSANDDSLTLEYCPPSYYLSQENINDQISNFIAFTKEIKLLPNKEVAVISNSARRKLLLYLIQQGEIMGAHEITKCPKCGVVGTRYREEADSQYHGVTCYHCGYLEPLP